MAISGRNVGRKGGDKAYDSSQARGVVEEKGIVIAIVKENAHSVRMGNIMVFIPGAGASGDALSGDGKKIEDDPTQWRMVRYATPWYSRTEATGGKTVDTEVKNTAGIIYPAPDIGTKVLCFFPEGKNAEGFWFACAPDPYMMQSLPEPTFSSNAVTLNSEIVPRGPTPAGELNDISTDTKTLKDYSRITRPTQTDFYENLVEQGLDLTLGKGLSNSGYMRETPAELIGITSKGRRIDSNGVDIKDRDDIIQALVTGDQQSGTAGDRLKVLKGFTRAKGHSIILDDGDTVGNNQLVRLRSAKGGQFLINDTDGYVYVINQKGTAWMSMDENGQIDVYSDKNINFRSTNMNFHAEKDIKMHAGNFIDLVSDNEVNLEAAQDVSVHATSGGAFLNGSESVHIKSGGITTIDSTAAASIKAGALLSLSAKLLMLQGPPLPPVQKSSISAGPAADTQREGDFWVASGSTMTTVDRMPAHEPTPTFGRVTEPKARGNRRSGGGGLAVASMLGAGVASGLSTGALGAGSLGGIGNLGSGLGLSSAVLSGGLQDSVLSGISSAGNPFSALTDSLSTGPLSGVVGGITDAAASTGIDIGTLTGGLGPGGAGGIVGNLSNITGGALNGIGVTKALDVAGASGLTDIANSVPGLTSITATGGFVQDFGTNLPIEFPMTSTISSVSSVGGFSPETLSSGGGVFNKITKSVGTSFGDISNVKKFAAAGMSNLPSFDPVKLLQQTDFSQGVGMLDTGTIKGMAAATSDFIGSGSAGNFVDSATGAIGKYGFTVNNLKDAGFVKSSTLLNGQMMDARNWTGKSGMNSFADFANNTAVQDSMFVDVTQKNMQKLASAGTILPNDPTDLVAGLVNISHTAGVENAANLRAGKPFQPVPVDGTSTILSTQDVQAKSNQLLGSTVGAVNSSFVKVNEFVGTSMFGEGTYEEEI